MNGSLALAVFAAVGEFALAVIVLTIGGYWPRIWLALRRRPHLHLASPPRTIPARQTPRSLPPGDSLFLTPASTRPTPGQKVRA